MKFWWTCLFAFSIYFKSASQDQMSFGLNGLSGYDFKNNRDNTTMSFNSYLLYFNFSFDYKFNSKIDANKSNDALVFGGVGYYNYYQIQIGRSSSGVTYLRQRTDWTLNELGLFKHSKRNDWDYNPFDFITVSLFVDKDINDSRQNWIVGFGVGYSIRVTGH